MICLTLTGLPGILPFLPSPQLLTALTVLQYDIINSIPSVTL